MKTLLARLRALFRKAQLDRDMAEEMRFHLAQRTADHVDDGLSADEACYAAQRKFGGAGLLQETASDQRGFVWLEQLFQDLRFAVRQLAKPPGLHAGRRGYAGDRCCANTAIFTVVDAVLLRPLPYP